MTIPSRKKFFGLLSDYWWIRLILVLVVAFYIVVVVFATISFIDDIPQSQIVYEDDPLFESIDAPAKGDLNFGFREYEGVRPIDKRYKVYTYNDWSQLGYLALFLIVFTAVYSFVLFVIWRISLYIIYGEKLINRIKKRGR